MGRCGGGWGADTTLIKTTVIGAAQNEAKEIAGCSALVKSFVASNLSRNLEKSLLVP